jgi:polar amino acid transport system substrate-binding protein
MKKILSLILVVVMLTSALCFAGCGGKDDNTLLVYTEAGFAPYEFIYNNEIVGVDIAIMQAVAEELGKELVITDVAFDTICTSVQNGKADAGAAGITIRPDRAEQVDFSIPYSSTEQYIIVPVSNDTIKTLEDLKGKKIGIQNGTTSDMLVADLIADKTLEGSEIIPYTSPAVAAASMNKQDAVVTDKLTAQLIVANDANLKAFPLVKADGTPAAEVEEYGICVQKGNKELLDTINKVLEQLIADGTIDKWVEEYSAKAKEVGA